MSDYVKSDGYLRLDLEQRREVIEQVEIQIKYDCYLSRQGEEIRRFQKIEQVKIPERFAFQGIPGLSREIVEKLTKVRPLSLGQASRIPGVTPAALSILMVYLHRSPHA